MLQIMLLPVQTIIIMMMITIIIIMVYFTTSINKSNMVMIIVEVLVLTNSHLSKPSMFCVYILNSRPLS